MFPFYVFIFKKKKKIYPFINNEALKQLTEVG